MVFYNATQEEGNKKIVNCRIKYILNLNFRPESIKIHFFMKPLNFFAAQNPRMAQIIIAVLLIIAGSVAFHGGIALFALKGLQIPILTLPLLIGFMYAIGKLYYAGESLKLHKSVHKKRTFVASLLVCWLFCFASGNRTAYSAMQPEQEEQTITTAEGHVSLLIIEGTDGQKAKNWFKWFTTKKKAAVKKEVDFFMKKRIKAGEMGDFGKILLALLVVLLYLLIMYVVLALACTLSCDGQETAAIIVLVLGLGLGTWGLIAALVAIFRKNTSNGEPSIPGEPTPRRGPSKKEKM